MRNLWKKGLSAVLTLSMVLSLMPTMAFAAECSHEHDESCGYVAAQEEIPCGHECGEDCVEGCIHETHDDACGYKEAVAEQPCTYVHGVECGCEEEISEEPEEETAAHADCDGCLVCEVADMINDLPDAEDITEENAAAVIDQIHAIDRVKFDLTDDEYLELMELIELETPDFGMAVPARYQAAVAAILALEDGAEFYISKEFLSVDGSDVDVTDAEVTFMIEGEGYSETITMTTMDYVLNSLSADPDFYSEEASGWTYKYILPAGTYTITEVSDRGATVEGKDFVTDSVSIEVNGEDFEGDTAEFTIKGGESIEVLVGNSVNPDSGNSTSCELGHTCHLTTDSSGEVIDGTCAEFTANTTELTVPENENTIYYCMTGDVTLNANVSVPWSKKEYSGGVWIYLCTGGHKLDLNGYDFIVDDTIYNGAYAVSFEIVDHCSNRTDANDITNDIPIYVEWKDLNDAQEKRPKKDEFSVVVTDSDDITETVSFENATAEEDIWTVTWKDAVAYQATEEEDNKWKFVPVSYSVSGVNAGYGEYNGPLAYVDDEGNELKPWNHVYMELDMPTTEINLLWDFELPTGVSADNVVVTLYADGEEADSRTGKLVFDSQTNSYKVVYGEQDKYLENFYDEEETSLVERYDFYQTEDKETPVYTLGITGLPDGYEAEVTERTITKDDNGNYSHTFTITLQTKKIKYAITVDSTENGTVTADRKEATEGDIVTITATPDEYYKLLDKPTVIGVDAEDITDNGDGTYTFTMPAQDVTVAAEFSRIEAGFLVMIKQETLKGTGVQSESYDLYGDETCNKVMLTDEEGNEIEAELWSGAGADAGKTYTLELSDELIEKGYELQEKEKNTFFLGYENNIGKIEQVDNNFGYVSPAWFLYVNTIIPRNELSYTVEWDRRIPEADKKGITLSMAATGEGVKFNSDGETNMGTITVAEEGTTTIQAVKYDSYGTEITGYSHTATTVDGWKIEVTQDTAAANKYIIFVTPVEHKIEVTENVNGSITVDGSRTTAAKGETITFNAAAKEGYRLIDVSVTNAEVTYDEKTGKYSFVMPDKAVTISAEIKKVHSITIPTEMPEGVNTVAVDKKEAVEGETVTITDLGFAAGYELDALTYTQTSGEPVTITEKDGSYSFTMPDGDVTVTATAKKTALIVSADSEIANGTVTFGENKEETLTAYVGDTITATVTPNENYGAVSVTTTPDTEKTIVIPESGEEFTFTFTMPAESVEVSATFAALIGIDTDGDNDVDKYVPGVDDDGDGIYEDADGNEIYLPVDNDTEDDADHYVPDGVLKDEDAEGKKDGLWTPGGDNDGPFYVPVYEDDDADPDGFILVTEEADNDGVYEDADGNEYIPDQDGDGKPEPDTDGDGIFEGTDDEKDNDYIPSGDKDGDGENDDYYVDGNGVGVFTEQDETTGGEKDNDDITYIPDQDGDDKPEPDANGDGIFEGSDEDKDNNYIPVVDGSDPAKAPSDEDKKKDDAVVDDNKDGIYDEMNGAGDEDGTNDTYYVPVDSDNDGKIDGVKEVTKDGDVYVDEDGTEYIPDQNGDGLPEVDDDGDGIFEDADGNRYNEDGSEYRPSSPSSNRGSTKYNIVVEETENGKIKSSDRTAKKGETITLTVTPDGEFDLRSLKVVDRNGNQIDLKDNGDGTFSFKMPRSSVTVTGSFGEEDLTTIILTIDSRIIWIDEEMIVYDVAPMIRNERTVLPIRVIAEALGASVAWNEPAQKVTIIKGDTVIEPFINQPYALVNGTPVQLDAPAFIENSRTYLPIRFISENLGASVVWDGLARTVTITD